MFLKVLNVFVLCCLLQSQSATFRTKSSNLIQPRIVGGKNANRGQFPYHILLADRLSRHYFCGGSIISNRYILSAAHCVLLYERHPSELLVVLDTSNIKDTDFTTVEISKAYAHPEYKNESFRFDISILLTRREIEFNNNIQTLQLPTIDYAKMSRRDAVIAGWGALWEPKTPLDRSSTPKNLQFQHTTTLSTIDCRNSFKQLFGDANNQSWIELDQDLDETIICTTNTVGTGMCSGDSGNGVVVGNTLVGITSSTFGCALGYPDIHTNLYSHLEWITTQMEHMAIEDDEESSEDDSSSMDFDDWF